MGQKNGDVGNGYALMSALPLESLEQRCLLAWDDVPELFGGAIGLSGCLVGLLSVLQNPDIDIANALVAASAPCAAGGVLGGAAGTGFGLTIDRLAQLDDPLLPTLVGLSGAIGFTAFYLAMAPADIAHWGMGLALGIGLAFPSLSLLLAEGGDQPHPSGMNELNELSIDQEAQLIYRGRKIWLATASAFALYVLKDHQAPQAAGAFKAVSFLKIWSASWLSLSVVDSYFLADSSNRPENAHMPVLQTAAGILLSGYCLQQPWR